MNATIIAIKKGLSNNSLEVEDLVKQTLKLEADSIPELLKITEELDLQTVEESFIDKNRRHIPFATWIEAATVVIGDKSNSIKFATRSPNHAEIIITFLEIQDPLFALKIASEIFEHSTEPEYRNTSITTFNSIGSFNKKLVIPSKIKTTIKIQVENYLTHFPSEANESEKLMAYCALRGFGDKETIELIKNQPKTTNPAWIGIESSVILEIKKRIKKASNRP